MSPTDKILSLLARPLAGSWLRVSVFLGYMYLFSLVLFFTAVIHPSPSALFITLPCLFPTSVFNIVSTDPMLVCPLLIVIFSLGTMDELVSTSLSYIIRVRKWIQF